VPKAAELVSKAQSNQAIGLLIDAAFVASMEDVLEVYKRPPDPQRPLVCLDETSKHCGWICASKPISRGRGETAALQRQAYLFT
jgi:hypothetical protein